MSVATEDPTGVELPKTSTYLADHQIKRWESEIQSMESMLKDPAARLEDRGEVIKNLRRTKYELEMQSPPDTTPMQRDALAREEKALLSEILEGMPSQAEMRRSPPGAVGKHRRWETANKLKILRLKNIQRVLNKGNDDPDISNLERYRPTTSTLNMDNALISGKDYFVPPNTQAYRDGYDRTFGNGAESDRIAELTAKIAELEEKFGKAQEPTAVPVQEHLKAFTSVAKCGRVASAATQQRADFGRRAHERACPKCKGGTPEEAA